MKEHFYAKADFAGFLIIGIAAALLCAVFIVRQLSFLPPDTETITGVVLNESKDKASSFKKYFPKPYSVQDLARGDA